MFHVVEGLSDSQQRRPGVSGQRGRQEELRCWKPNLTRDITSTNAGDRNCRSLSTRRSEARCCLDGKMAKVHTRRVV